MKARSLLQEKFFTFSKSLIGLVFIGLVSLTPLPFGSVQANAITVMQTAIFLCGIVWLLKLSSGESQTIRVTPLGGCLILFLGLIVFQMVPLANPVLCKLSPMVLQIRHAADVESGSSYTISMIPFLTYRELLQWTAYTFFYLLAVNFNSRRWLYRIMWTIVLIASFEAMYGLYQCWSEKHEIFGFKNIYSGDFATGTFINKNHFAAFLEAILPFVVLLFLSKLDELRYYHKSFKELLYSFASERNIPYILIPFVTVLILVAIVFSGSRGGFLSLFISISLFFFLSFLKKKKEILKIGLSVLVLFVVLVSLWLPMGNISKVTARFQTVSKSFQERQEIWADSLAMASEFPFFGVGLGVFAEAYPKYNQSFKVVEKKFVNHAHNEYLELLCEAGLVGFFILVLGGLLALIGALRKYNYIRAVLIYGVLCISIHNFFDFNLHIPANFLMYLFLFAMLENKMFNDIYLQTRSSYEKRED